MIAALVLATTLTATIEVSYLFTGARSASGKYLDDAQCGWVPNGGGGDRSDLGWVIDAELPERNAPKPGSYPTTLDSHVAFGADLTLEKNVFGPKDDAGRGKVVIRPDGSGAITFAGWINALEEKVGGTISWHCVGGVEANPGPARDVLRGQPVELDGSASRGTGLSYEWTLAPVEGCPAKESVQLHGAKIKTVFLCPTDATLRVNDGKDSDAKTVRIGILRRWRTPFALDPKPSSYSGGSLISGALSIDLGKNICEFAPDDEYNSNDPVARPHQLHAGNARDKANGDSPEPGFEVAQVKDAGGPFDGWWYVSKYDLKIRRRMLINRRLFRGSALYKVNTRAGEPYRSGIKDLFEQVEDHERMHSKLVEKSLAKLDPAERIEPLMDRNEQELRETVARVIGNENVRLQSDSDELLVKAALREKWGGRRGALLRPISIDVKDSEDRADYKNWDNIPPYADLGTGDH